MSTEKRNAIIIHGGGLVDPSKVVLLRLARTLKLSGAYDNIIIGKYSFESLYTKEFWYDYRGSETEVFFRDKRGTCFGTCRGINLTDPKLSKTAIECLKSAEVTTIIVAGGDGSSRQVAEISDTFMENGINIILAIPLTIDGINGGPSIGIKEAVAESIRQIENIASTSLETRDNGAFGVVMVELQGRNRDDIMGNVLKEIFYKDAVADEKLDEILLRVIPANFDTDEEKLIEEINNSTQKTLVLVSEGAKIKIPELTKKINRKVRSLTVGHPSQSNGMTSPENIKKYYEWIDAVCSLIEKSRYGTYSLVDYEDTIVQLPINYYAELNPLENQKAKLPDFLEYLIKKYMTK